MQFGMPTLIGLPAARENAALCRELGLAFVELNMNLPQFQLDVLERELETYRGLQVQTGIFFTLHLDENLDFADFNPLVREAWLRTAARAVRIAKALEMPAVNLHMPEGVHFTLPDQKVYLFEAYADCFRAAVREFRDVCAEAAGAAPVRICIENTGGYKPFQRAAIETLLEAPCFALTWDIGHSHAAKDADEPFLLAHKDRLAHFHIHDALAGNCHLPLGTGEIDLAARLSLAEAQGCRCVIETKTAAALKASVRYLQDFAAGSR